MASQALPMRLLRFLRRRLRDARWCVKRLFRRPVHIHIQNGWRLGDEILAIPFYQLVAEAFPRAIISVAVNYPELLTGNPHVTVATGASEFDCDRYLFIQEDPRSRERLEHLCRLHRIPCRALAPEVRAPKQMDLPIPLPEGTAVVAYSCGAGWACKSWPTSLMRDLLRSLERECPGITFVEMGKACPSAGMGICYVDKLSVSATAHVLSRCTLYIGPDSGLAHLAMAVGTQAAIGYGPVVPRVAFGQRDALVPLLSPAECQGCWTHGRMTIPGRCPLGIIDDAPVAYPCMQKLTAEYVLATMRSNGLLPLGAASAEE